METSRNSFIAAAGLRDCHCESLGRYSWYRNNIGVIDMAPECEICGENVKRVYECEICGTAFCKECGDPSEKICQFCSEEEEEGPE